MAEPQLDLGQQALGKIATLLELHQTVIPAAELNPPPDVLRAQRQETLTAAKQRGSALFGVVDAAGKPIPEALLFLTQLCGGNVNLAESAITHAGLLLKMQEVRGKMGATTVPGTEITYEELLKAVGPKKAVQLLRSKTVGRK